MNAAELQSRLRSVPVPERTEEYWNDFPATVRVQLPKRERYEFAPRNVWRLRLARAGALALAIGLICVGERFHPLHGASEALNRGRENVRVHFAQMETGLRLLMFNPHGMGYLLAEAN
jgi:ferric-dicitrate binding protein FerR (iron transport regulator)